MLTLADSIDWIPILAQDGEFSPRAFWFLAIVLILAIQHFVEKAKERRAEEEIQRRVDDDDDYNDYELDDEEVGYSEPESPKGRLAAFLKQVAEEQTRRMAPVVLPTPPQPDPEPQQRRLAPAPVKPPEPILSLAEQEALEKIKKSKSNHLSHGRSKSQRFHSSADHNALGKMLRDPMSLRNAFILKEVLEPPLAARDEPFPHNN